MTGFAPVMTAFAPVMTGFDPHVIPRRERVFRGDNDSFGPVMTGFDPHVIPRREVANGVPFSDQQVHFILDLFKILVGTF